VASIRVQRKKRKPDESRPPPGFAAGVCAIVVECTPRGIIAPRPGGFSSRGLAPPGPPGEIRCFSIPTLPRISTRSATP
jgi:hypothetical protein